MDQFILPPLEMCKFSSFSQILLSLFDVSNVFLN